jgi:hypothetical protein
MVAQIHHRCWIMTRVTGVDRPRGGAIAVVVARQLAGTRETLGRGGDGSESPSVLDHDEGHRGGQAM